MIKRLCRPIWQLPTWETGLAIFSMFFGAGNVIFPLIMGRDSGHMIWIGILGLTLMVIGLVMLGPFAIMPRCFTVAYGAITPYFPELSLLTFTIIAGIA